MLRAKSFGTPLISLTDQPLAASLGGKGLAIFAYLAVNREPQLRPALIDLLWQNVSDQQARDNLRSLLYNLRQILGDYLLVTRQTVALNRQLPYWLDVEVFASYLAIGQASSDPLLLTEVINLYQPEFLSRFYLPNTPAFETWLLGQRQHWHDRAMQGWQQLANYHLEQANYAEGLTATRRLLALEPWHEEAHRQQMLLLALSGQRAAALAQYELCCQSLRAELDVAPSAATTALCQQIKADDGGLIQHSAAQEATLLRSSAIHRNGNYAAGVKTLPNGDTVVTPNPTMQQPLSPIDWGSMPREARFYGRVAELRTLQQWLLTENCRLVAILGVGGQGKTALAAHFVQTIAAGSGQSAWVADLVGDHTHWLPRLRLPAWAM